MQQAYIWIFNLFWMQHLGNKFINGTEISAQEAAYSIDFWIARSWIGAAGLWGARKISPQLSVSCSGYDNKYQITIGSFFCRGFSLWRIYTERVVEMLADMGKSTSSSSSCYNNTRIDQKWTTISCFAMSWLNPTRVHGTVERSWRWTNRTVGFLSSSWAKAVWSKSGSVKWREVRILTSFNFSYVQVSCEMGSNPRHATVSTPDQSGGHHSMLGMYCTTDAIKPYGKNRNATPAFKYVVKWRGGRIRGIDNRASSEPQRTKQFYINSPRHALTVVRWWWDFIWN